MRQRSQSLPRPLDTDHTAVSAELHSEEASKTVEALHSQPGITTQQQRHPVQPEPGRMERAGSARHKDAAIMGLTLSPELAAIALGVPASLAQSAACLPRCSNV